MSSRIVYTPGFQHVCLATKDASEYEEHTIIRCQCSRYYEARVLPLCGSQEWKRIRPWNLRAQLNLHKARHFIIETCL